MQNQLTSKSKQHKDLQQEVGSYRMKKQVCDSLLVLTYSYTSDEDAEE
jgi:hypothetical protein